METETGRDQRESALAVPGAIDSTLLLLDMLLALLRLGSAEATQALGALPQFLSLSLYRLPVLLLTWISFGVLMACSAYALTENLMLAAASFFVLQLGLSLLLELRSRRLRQKMAFVETRKGVAALQHSVKERFGHDAA